MLPGFMLGYSIYKNIETINWQSPNTIIRYYSDHKAILFEFNQKEIITYKIPIPPGFRAIPEISGYYADRYEINGGMFLPPERPCIFWGGVMSIFSFFLVLFSLKGIMFIIRWIVAGFKE